MSISSLAVQKQPATMNMAGMVGRATDVANLLGVMASPVRLLILCALVEGEKPVHELVALSAISQGAVSQHLAKMRNLKLLTTRRQGQTIMYSLSSNELRTLLATLHRLYCQ